jgi:putative transposase
MSEAKNISDEGTKNLSNVIKIDEKVIQDHLGEMIKGTVEDTLNALLDAEADRLCQATKYERTPKRKDTRAGYYQRDLETRAGTVELNVPKLRTLPFDSAIIQRYRRREISVEEALVEMYLAGVSVRRVEDITQALWGTRVSAGAVSQMNQKIYQTIEAWRMRPIEGEYIYVYLDGIVLKRTWGHEVKNVSLLVGVGVNAQGERDVLGIAEGQKEDKEGWLGFLRHLKDRGLKEPKLVTSDRCLGLVEALTEVYPKSDWQRCIVHFYRNILSKVPNKKMKDVAAMLKAIHAQESAEEARKKAKAVIEGLQALRYREAAKILEEGIEETLLYYGYPREHWLRIRTNNPLERLMREIRRRTRVVGSFPDGKSALMLAAARLRYIASSRWGTVQYLNMDRIKELEKEKHQTEEKAG